MNTLEISRETVSAKRISKEELNRNSKIKKYSK